MLQIHYDPLSRYVVREMAVRAQTPGGYVTAEDLRDVPLASVLPVVFEEEDVIQDLPNPDDHEPWSRVPPANVKDYRVPAILPWVAQVYRLAWAVGSNPTKDVQEKFGGIPRSTAANWIDKARDAGLLKRTRQGKGGV